MKPLDSKGGASRFFYTAKATKKERNLGLEGLEDKKVNNGAGLGARKCSNCNKWEDDAGHPKCHCEEPNFERVERTTKNTHPTVKPLSLMVYLCKLTKTPTGGKVLDPFMGSGTTGMACKLTDRDFVGIEQNEEYIKIAKARIEAIDGKIADKLLEEINGITDVVKARVDSIDKKDKKQGELNI